MSYAYIPSAVRFSTIFERYTSRKLEEGGCVVKFPTPAWSSTNLLNIAKFVESGLVFAHVRAASDGAVLVGSVNHENTHPFQVWHHRSTYIPYSVTFPPRVGLRCARSPFSTSGWGP